MERPVSFQSGGARLFGTLGDPDSAAPKQGIVIIHGWSGYRIGPHRILVAAARAFNESGAATLRFDLRGRGDSEGDPFDVGLDDMIDDALAAIDFLKNETGCERVGLLGMCSGSNVAIGTATLNPEIRDLILWSILTFQTHKKAGDSARRGGRFAVEYARKIFRADTWRKLFRGAINFKMISKVIFGGEPKAQQGERNLKDSKRDIVSEFEKWRGSCLFIHGDKDPEAPGARDVFMELCASQDNIRAEFDLVEGANHNFHSAEWKSRVIKRSIEWFEKSASSGELDGSST